MTNSGRFLLAASATLGGIGWLLDNRMWMSLGVIAISVLALVRALLGTWPRVQLRVQYPARAVRAGDDARFGIVTEWRRRPLFNKRLTVEAAGLPTAIVGARAPSTALSVPTQRRGIVAVPELIVRYADPWGLFSRVVASARGMEILIYPRVRKLSLPDLLARLEADSARSRTGEEQFHTLRDYVLGDEPRYIHWRSSARLGHLVVRQQIASAHTTVAVVLDNLMTSYEGLPDGADAFEQAVEVAAGLVEYLHRRGIPFAVMAADHAFSVTCIEGQPLEPAMRGLALIELTHSRFGLALTQRELRSVQSAMVVLVSPQPSALSGLLPYGAGLSVVDPLAAVVAA